MKAELLDAKSLLKYMSESNLSNVADTEIATLHELVSDVKRREGIGDSYMTYGDVMNYEREIGYEQGMQQGMEILIQNNIECEIPECKTIKVLQTKYNLNEEQALEMIASVKAKM